jgi:hypothetical protein
MDRHRLGQSVPPRHLIFRESTGNVGPIGRDRRDGDAMPRTFHSTVLIPVESAPLRNPHESRYDINGDGPCQRRPTTGDISLWSLGR